MKVRKCRTKIDAAARRLTSLWNQNRAMLLFLLLIFCFRSAWADWVRVPTGSMNPTIVEGDRLFVDKHVYGLRVPFTLARITTGRDPARGEIVVFDSPQDGVSLVKRVVALPGDTIALDREALIVNGRRAAYSPGDAERLRTLLQKTQQQLPAIVRESGLGPAHDILVIPSRPAPRSFDTMTVPAGMYFMMGDNRDNSADSRYIGFVPRRNIVGRASRVVLSFDPERYFLPRRQRVLQPLG